jgi:superfamily II DNA or RNA helicase
MSGLTLRPYQEEAVQAVRDSYLRGVRRQLIGLPTGTGKTVVFSEIIRRAGEKGTSSLVLAHRDELLWQAADKIRQVDPGAAIGMVKRKQNDVYSPIVVASVQTLARENRLAQLPQQFGVVVVDEAHHSAADSYQRILRHVGSFDPDVNMLTLGVTATPSRADSRDLADTWQEVVYNKGILEMIRGGYLTNLRGLRVRMRRANFSRLKISHGDFQDAASSQILQDAGAPEHAAQAYKEHADGRTALVFTPTVSLAHAMTAEFERFGVTAATLHGGTPMEERRELLRRFRKGEVKVISNCAVLTEGFDEPRIDCIIVARPTRSKVLYVQMVGRGTRTYPGKDDCLIIDMVGAAERFDLMTMPNLFGLREYEEKLTDGEETITDVLDQIADEALSAEEAEAAREERERVMADLVAQRVDLFNRRELHWIKLGNGDALEESAWILNSGSGYVALEPDEDERWKVTFYPSQRHDKARVIATQLDLGYAQGHAEDYVREDGGMGLSTRTSAWRRRPATGPQLSALRKRRIATWTGITSGEASDLITAASVRSRQKAQR